MKLIDKMISFLLENANPSIKRRVKSEVSDDLTTTEEELFQELILAEPIIQKSLPAKRKTDG